MDGVDGFKEMKDHRRGNALKYPLDEILLVALATVLTGGETYVDMADFAEDKLDLLRRLRPFEHGAPSHDTFGRVLSALDTERFGIWFANYMEAIARLLNGVIAVDGKTLRRSFDTASGQSPIHMINAWASDCRLVLAQLPVDDKTNEIPAVQRLLSILDLREATVTADAMHCQRETATQILAQGGDYALQVKGNQGRLHEDLQTFWELGAPPGTTMHRTVDQGHGRIETRTVQVCERIDWVQEEHDWPGLEAVVLVEATRELKRPREEADQEPQASRRHYLLSRVCSAREAAAVIRAHWGVENQVHWTLDVVFNEDQSRVRSDNGPSNLSLLRKMAMNALRQEPSALSLARKRRRAARDDEYLLKLLSFV